MTPNSTRKITVVGGMNLDLLAFPNAPLIEKDSNPGKITLRPGGVGRNIAARLAAMGAENVKVLPVSLPSASRATGFRSSVSLEPSSRLSLLKRMLAGTERAKSVFSEESYTSATAIGETVFYYENIAALAESRDYFVFLFSFSHAQIYDKRTLAGGSAEEFRAFLERRCGKSFTRIG